MKRSCGFTFVEMMICVVIIALIGLAIGGFSISVTTYWKQINQQQILQNTGEKSQATLGSIVESARAFGVVNDGGRVQMLVWYSDSLNGVADGIAQLGEMGLIEYDPALQSIMFYQGNLTQTYETSSSASSVVESADFTKSAVAEYLKRQTWLYPSRSLLGPGRVLTTDTSATTVLSAAFSAKAGTARNGVSVTAKLKRDSEISILDNRFNVRAAMNVPVAPLGSTTVTALVEAAQTVADTVTNILR